jgi:hypothetical protein
VAKAEKWLRTRGDARYSFLWIMKAIEGLAAIEVLLHGEIVEREVVQQALRHNPAFFDALYTRLMDGPKTPEAVGAALEAIEGYLRGHAAELFGPLFDYLAEAGGLRSSSEISAYFEGQMGLGGALDSACEWLADIDLIAKVGTPVHLTDKSRVEAQEAAYYFERGDDQGNGRGTERGTDSGDDQGNGHGSGGRRTDQGNGPGTDQGTTPLGRGARPAPQRRSTREGAPA